MTEILLDLPPELTDALEHRAGRNEDIIDDIVRKALRHDFQRRARVRNNEITERFVPLRKGLSQDMAEAADWPDLQNRLRKSGYQLVRCDADPQ